MNRLIPPTTIERYFSLHYAPTLARLLTPQVKSQPFEDVCIARHHNGICLVCISPRHPIIREKKQVTDVDYRVEMRQVKGKRKKGGIVVEERTRLCTLTCASGEVYGVQCAVKGTLMEYNNALKTDSTLVAHKPLTDGYLAVVLPWPSKIKTAVDALVTAEEYERQEGAGDDEPQE